MHHTLLRHSRPRQRLAWSALGLLSGLAMALPASAADKIYFKRGSLVRSLPVSSLETFAANGTVDSELEFYFRTAQVDEAKRADFRQALQTPAPIDGQMVSRFLYSGVGEDLLDQFGGFIQIRGGTNGRPALRAAVVGAVSDPQGLTLLNVLRHLPTDMQIDLDTVEQLQQTVDGIVQATQESVVRMAELSDQEAANEPPVDYSTLPDITQPGSFRVTERQITLTVPDRAEGGQRTFYVNLYQPQGQAPGRIPVIVFSHGLSSAPEEFSDELRHLASYGFVVAAPQHIGSDRQHTADFQAGLARELFEPNEFINRPYDISAVIDELERRNDSEFGGQLDLQTVGVGGHSFGGYTALAVAGAKIDFDHLQEDCDQRFAFLNASLLLQCQALKLPRQDYNFRDPRVKAVTVLNPVNNSIFGPRGLGRIQIPVGILAGSHDIAAPAVFEQFRSFPWLQTPNRVLGLLEGQAHVDLSDVDAGITNLIGSLPGLTLASPTIVKRYTNGMGVAFYQLYVARKVDYRIYLRSAYSEYLSQGQPFKIYLISAVSESALEPLEQPPLLR